MCKKSQKREFWKLQLFHWWAISGQVYSIDDRPCSYWGKGTRGAKFQKESPLIVPTASVVIHDSMGWYVLSSLPPLSPPDKLLLPTPQVSFKLPSPVNVSHHSPSSVLLGTRDIVPLDLVSRYLAYWLCFQLLLESDCILRAVSISHCNPDQCLDQFLSKCSQLFVVKWSKGIYV